MKKFYRIISLLLVMGILLAGCGGAGTVTDEPAYTSSAEVIGELSGMSTDVIDPDLTCTITLGNWPADTAPESERALFDGYKATMEKQYPNVTLVPDYFSYTLSNYVPMAKGGTAPSIFQPPFTDPQLLISQGLVGDVTDALEAVGVLDKFSPAYYDTLADAVQGEDGRA